MIPTVKPDLPEGLIDFLPRMRAFDRFDGGRRLMALVALGKLAQKHEVARIHWQNVRNVTAHYGDPRRQRDALLETSGLVEQMYPALRDVFTGALISDVLHASGDLPGLVMLAYDLVERFSAVRDEAFGLWFDSAVDEVTGGRDASQITTPRSIATLLVRLADPQTNQTMLDPCCGLGSVLARSQEYANGLQLFGQEVNTVAAATARLRLFLLQANAEIEIGDALRAPARWTVTQQFDRIVCDPPYGMASSALDEARLRERFHDLPRRYEVLFLAHCLEQLKANGRAIVLMPYGFLFRHGREAAFRRQLVEEGRLEGVIVLPGGTVSWTGISLAIVVLRGKSEPMSEVTFLDASYLKNLGKGPIDRLSPDNIEDLARSYFTGQDDKFCMRVGRDAVLEGEVDLQPTRFVRAPLDDRPDIGQLTATARLAEGEAADALEKFEAILAGLQVSD